MTILNDIVSSDTNDFVVTEPIDADTIEEFREGMVLLLHAKCG